MKYSRAQIPDSLQKEIRLSCVNCVEDLEYRSWYEENIGGAVVDAAFCASCVVVKNAGALFVCLRGWWVVIAESREEGKRPII